MKKLLYTFLFTIMASTVHAYNVSITVTAGSAGDSLLDDASGNNPIALDSLGVLLVDTLGNGITLAPINNLTDDSFLGNTDNFVAGITGSSDISESSVVEFSAEPLNSIEDFTGALFYVAWFPNLNSHSTIIRAGERFGTSRDDSWILQADGETFGDPNNGMDTPLIPETSTYAIGLSALVLAFSANRRLRKA